MHHTIDQLRFLSAAAVDVDESEQGACGESFIPESRMHGYYDQQTPLPTPIPSASDEEGSKSGSESPKKHGGGLFCKERIPKSNSSSGSSTPSDSKEPSVPSTDGGVLQKIQRVFTSPFKRNGKARASSKSNIGSTVTEKQPDPKQNNTFPTRKGRSNPTSQINSTLNEFSPQQTVDSGQRFIDAAALDAQENLSTFSREGLGRDSGRYSDENRPTGSSQSSRESSRDSSPVSSDSGTSSRYSPSSEIVSPTAKRLTPSRETVV